MRVNVTFRHMEPTEAIKEYAQEKVERIKKYFPDPITAHVVMTTERGYQHVADVTITLHNGLTLKGHESTEDMYSSIDLVMAKIERQVRRYKDKIRSHKPTGTNISVRELVIEAESFDRQLQEEIKAAEAMAATSEGGPKIIRSSKFFAKAMTVEEAVMEMNLAGGEFLVFMNSQTNEVNVVYRQKDGNYGLIETGHADAQEVGAAAAGASQARR